MSEVVSELSGRLAVTVREACTGELPRAQYEGLFLEPDLPPFVEDDD